MGLLPEHATRLQSLLSSVHAQPPPDVDAEWNLVQKIQRAAPGTEIGKKIALIDKIDRADVAALFMQELDLEKLFAKRGSKTYDTTFRPPTEASTAMETETVVKMEPATDIADNWLKPSIDAVLKLQVRGLEAGPNHTFEPTKLITKAEFALMLEDILIRVTGDEKLATKYVGSPSLFPDVRSDFYAFNAIMVVTSRGFLEADKATGEFRPGDPVSGADALLAEDRSVASGRSMRAIAATPRASFAAVPKLASKSGASPRQACSRLAATASAPTRSSATIKAVPTLCANTGVLPSCSCAYASARQGRSFSATGSTRASDCRADSRSVASKQRGRTVSFIAQIGMPVPAVGWPIF